MLKTRRRYTPEFKAKVAIDAMKEHKTTTQLASEYGVASGQITTWKKQLVSHCSEIL